MTYVTSDLHGYPLEKFKELLKSVNFSDNDTLYVLGDVIDRGYDSVALLKWMMSQFNVELILGNHEAMMLASDFVFKKITNESIDELNEGSIGAYSTWMANGGQITVNALVGLPKEEIEYIFEYLREAPLYETLTVNGRDFLLTHSGIENFDEKKKLAQYDAHAFLWNRPDINDKYYSHVFTVFGHTPTVYYGKEYEGKALKTETWIDIDTGAAMDMSPMLLRLDDMKEFYFL